MSMQHTAIKVYKAEKDRKFMRKIVVLLLILIETWIVDTFKNRPVKAVLNELPRSVLSNKKRKMYTSVNPSLILLKLGSMEV